MQYSTLSETLASSEIIQIGNQVKQMIRDGEVIYNLTIGDFDPDIFPIPQELEDKIIRAYRDHFTSYPLAQGNLDLRQAIKRYIKEFQELDYAEEEILVASGGRPLIYALFMALCDNGDKIIYPVPSWNNHYYSHFVSGSQIIIETKEENKFMPLADEIRPFIETATLIALCSPQNPTGTIFKKKDLKEICDMVVQENNRRPVNQKKLYIFFDQMYSQLVYGNAKHYNPIAVCPGVRPYTITVDAISKSFAATGVRVGWCMGPPTLITKMKTLLTHIGAWAPGPEQKGLAGYLKEGEAIRRFLENFKNELNMRLQYLYEGIIQLKNEGYPVDAIAPEAAIYLSIKINCIDSNTADGILKNAGDVTGFLLKKAKLALVPFYAFGSNNNGNWYRLSVGTCKSEEMDRVLLKLRQALDCIRPAKETVHQDTI